MTSGGLSSQGLSIKRGNGASPEVFTDIADITGHEGPNRENPELDVTTLQSEAKEFIPGLVDNGELTIDLLFDPAEATHEQLLADQDSRSVVNWRIAWGMVSPVKNWTFPGFVKSFAPRTAVDSPMTGSLTIRITGAVVRT